MASSSASACATFGSISPLALVLRLLLLLLFNAEMSVLGQHQSFGDTKFDLPADLPPEDSLPPIANSQDAAPSTAAPPPPSPPAVATDAAPPPPPPSAAPQPAEAAESSVTPPAPLPLPPSPTATDDSALTPTVASSVPPAVAPVGSTGTPNSKTPLPSLPNLIELPNFVENGNVQPITVPPSLIEENGTSNAASSPSAPPQFLPTSPSAPPPPPRGRPPHQQVPSAKVSPPLRGGVGIGTVHQQKQQMPKDGQKIVVRSKEWFREEFDVQNCPKSSDALAKAIRAKFPRNLLRHGKDTVLAELLGTRLAECLRKQSENHWTKLDKQLKQHDKELDRNEKDECRAGLVEEQIACMNIYSFTCQFVHPSYLFRLLPTRIIVQEGRIAEEGAEKCLKFARKFLAHEK
ncbi:hypothetical protein niasHT_013634 [Heterodera trifolii]|uniref:Uncharacterized protein n=1 Tax=Heterodera trifolii TaxID=157864 RepID=A0ABD2LIM3_9BILA